MPHQLTLELADDIFQPLDRAARSAGQTVEEWATAQLQSCAANSTPHAGDLTRLLAHAGAIDLGKATGAGNESIDADLAREYASEHEDGR